MTVRERIADSFGEDTILFDGCDDAIIGVTNCTNSTGQVVYSYAKLVDVFVGQGMTHEEACEWVDFNVAGAGIKNGPLVIADRNDEEDE